MAAPLHCTQCGLEQEDDARFCPGCGTAIVTPKAIAPTPVAAPASSAASTSPASSDEKSLLGMVVADRYRLVETIGQGDSGVVYRAEHTTLMKKVAVKILHVQMSRDEAAIERFRREATTVAEIDNDHILQVSDFGRTPDGRLFFAMELLDGKTLTEVLEKEKRLTVTRALDIAIQIGEALVEAHGLGYVHRDLKPRNVFLIQRRGRADFVKLLDFGLAKLVEPGGQMRQTAMGMTFGDPRYMAPEAVKGDAIDRRVDIYALGAILCEMLTGAPPYEGSGTFDILQKQLDGSVPRLRERRPELPEWLERVVQKALAKQADDRFVTALKMIEHLREQAAPVGEVGTKRDVTPAPTPKTVEAPAPVSAAGLVGKETMMLGRLRNPSENETNGNNGSNGANNAAPSPSVSPIVSTQKMAAIGKGAGPVGANDKNQTQKQSNKQQQKNKQANAPGKAAPNDSTRPAPLAVSGTTAPRQTPKDSAAANSTSGEMSIGERNGREPSQKVPTVMFDSAVEALGPEQAPPRPQPEKNNRRPGAVQTKLGVQAQQTKPGNASSQTKQGMQPHQVQPKPNDSGEHQKPVAEADAPVIEASGEDRRDEPSGESQWFNNGPVLDEDEELEPVRKSRAGMYAGLGVGGAVVLLVLMIALWPRQKVISDADKREANDKPAAAAPSVAVVTPTANPTPAATTAPTPAPEPLKPSSVIVSPLPTPEPTPPVAPVPEDEGKIVKAKVEDRRKPIEEREPMPRDPAPAPAPVAIAPQPAKLAPSKQAVEELKPSASVAAKDPKEPAKDPKEPKASKPLPVGFKDPFSEAPRPTNSGQAESLVRLGRQKLAAGDINGALAQFNKAREADPASADALAGMGEVSFEQGDYNAAAQFLKQALRGSPNRPRYIVLLGQAYYKLGRARDAANEYRRALRLDPDNEEAQRSLELAEKKLGN